MKKLRFVWYVVAIFLVGSLSLVGYVLSRPKHTSADKGFDADDVRGRYVSAENAYDVSSVHSFAAPNGSLVGGPVFFATAEVMIADGNGNVCGEADGFYGGFPPPGVNLGPALFHGTYTIEAATGRITIITCSDGAPSLTNTFCGTSTACVPPPTGNKIQVGYLQRHAGVITTVEQTTPPPADQDVNGFLVHKRVWTKNSAEED